MSRTSGTEADATGILSMFSARTMATKMAGTTGAKLQKGKSPYLQSIEIKITHKNKPRVYRHTKNTKIPR
jgi:hypothetical protein